MNYLNNIFKEDCNEFMKKLPSECIDYCIADFPYNISNFKNSVTKKGNNYTNGSFGEWDKWDTQTDYLMWVFKTCAEIKRVLKPNASCLFFFALKQAGWIGYELERRSMFVYKSPIIWQKVNPIPHLRKTGFRSTFEHGLWMINSSEKYIDDYKAVIKPRTFNFLTQAEMCNVMPYAIGNKETFHKTEKPHQLINRMIRVFTNENDIILDPFMGSGCTAVESIKLKRRFTGTELSPEYFQLCQNRIKDELQKAQLF
jgi:DNA modification methylase